MHIRESLRPADFISPQMNIAHFMKRCLRSPFSLSAFVLRGLRNGLRKSISELSPS